MAMFSKSMKRARRCSCSSWWFAGKNNLLRGSLDTPDPDPEGPGRGRPGRTRGRGEAHYTTWFAIDKGGVRPGTDTRCVSGVLISKKKAAVRGHRRLAR